MPDGHNHTQADAPQPHVHVAHRFAMVPEALLYSPDISAQAVRVYGVLLRYGSDPTNCYPSHVSIAAHIGASPRSVPAWIRELEAAGWVERHARTTPAGDPDSNGYTVHAVPITRAAQRGVRASQRGGVRASQHGGSAPASAPNESHGNESHGNEKPRAIEPADTVTPLVENLQQSLAVAREVRDRTVGHDLSFEAFWQAYPLKVGKIDARKAWTAALRQASDADIIAGARRYADDPNRSPEFTKHPGPWLRAGRWADVPLPGRGPQPGQGLTRGQAAIDAYQRGRTVSEPARGVLQSGDPTRRELR